MLTEHTANVTSLKSHETARKTRTSREYMRPAHNLYARIIKACKTNPIFIICVPPGSSVVPVFYSRSFAVKDFR